MPFSSRHLRPIIYTLILIALAMASLACSKDGESIAKVGDTEIDAHRWAAYAAAASLPEDAPQHVRRETLDGLVRRSVAAIQTDRRGLLKEEDETWRMNGFMEEAIVYALFEDRLTREPDFTEEQVQERFFELHEERHIRHIVCATEEEAHRLRQLLTEGASIKELAQKHSLDKNTAEKGGDMGWLQRTQFSAAIAEQVFGAEEGDILAPFQASMGWEVVLVADARAPDQARYELQKEKVRNQMKQERGSRIRQELVTQCQKQYPITVRQENLPKADQEIEVLPNDENVVVGEVGNVEISLKDLKQFVVSAARRAGTPVPRGKTEMVKYLSMMANEKAVYATALSEGFDKRPEVAARAWNADQGYRARVFSSSYLQEVPVADAALEMYYEQNLETFRAPNKVRLLVLEAKDTQPLADAVREMRKGSPLSAVKRKYAVRVPEGGDGLTLDYSNPPPGIPGQALRTMASSPKGVWFGPYSTQTGLRAYQVTFSESGGTTSIEDLGSNLRNAYLKDKGPSILETYLDGDGRKGIAVEILAEKL